MPVYKTTIYRLQSSPAVYAPGLIAWAINGAHFKRDRAMLIKLVADSYSLPRPAASALVTGKTPYKVDGETVVFETKEKTS